MEMSWIAGKERRRTVNSGGVEAHGDEGVAVRRHDEILVGVLRNSPMTAAIGHRPSASVDEDLQNLYNEVWAGFADEPGAPPTAPSPQDDLDNIYSVYAAEPEYPPQTASTTPVSPSSIRSCTLCSSPACIC